MDCAIISNEQMKSLLSYLLAWQAIGTFQVVVPLPSGIPVANLHYRRDVHFTFSLDFSGAKAYKLGLAIQRIILPGSLFGTWRGGSGPCGVYWEGTLNSFWEDIWCGSTCFLAGSRCDWGQ